MRQMTTVFRFEFFNYLRGKAYRTLTLLVTLLVLLGMSYPRLTGMLRETSVESGQNEQVEAADTAPLRVAVACPPDMPHGVVMARQMTAQLPAYAWTGVALDEAALTEAVRAGEYDAGLWMETELTYRYIVQNSSMHDAAGSLLDDAIVNVYRSRALADLGLPPEEAASLAKVRATGETVALGRDGLVSYIHTYVLVMLLYMAVALYGQFVAASVAAEKSNRAMELLITSTRPTQLMFGKVLGAGTAGLLQMSLFLAAAFAGYHLNYELWQDNALMRAVFAMPASLAGYAALFFVLGFFLYASLYAALGSLVSRSEEVSTVTMPVTLIFIVSFMVVMVSAGTGSVDNAAMYTASFIPFSSPMAMFVRVAMGTPSVLEIALSVGILAISAVLVALIAAGIYRVGVLLYGKPPKIRELYRALRAAGSR